MQFLLRLSLLCSMLYCCWHLIRCAPRGDTQSLQRATRWLRGFSWLSGALLLLWIAGFLRH